MTTRDSGSSSSSDPCADLLVRAETLVKYPAGLNLATDPPTRYWTETQEIIRDLIADLHALSQALPDESLRVMHARKQGAADGFQDGWHAALKRVTEGNRLSELQALVPSSPVAQLHAEIETLSQALHQAKEDTRTVKSLATMFGWENVPPRYILEAEISAIKTRIRELSAARHAAGTHMNDWQPIATAPKDADCVLLWADGWGVQPGYWDDESQRWIATETQSLTGGWMGDGPTHWMPMPLPPLPAPPGEARQDKDKD